MAAEEEDDPITMPTICSLPWTILRGAWALDRE